jgi:hypothetical protein
MRAVAFAYCNAIPQYQLLYAALIDGMVKNVREKTNLPLLMVTDDTTPAIHGVHCLRVPKEQPLMVWRLKAHQMAHTFADEVLFVEPDVRIVEDISHVWDEPFDVTVTPRTGRAKFNGEEITERAPYTLGLSFSRSDEFWRAAKIFCQTLSKADQTWMGDMYSVAEIVKVGAFKVKELDGRTYNRVPDNKDDMDGAKVIHYGGKRKAWLFPVAQEAA